MDLQCTQRFGVTTQSTITIRNVLSVEFLLEAEGIIASMKHNICVISAQHKPQLFRCLQLICGLCSIRNDNDSL